MALDYIKTGESPIIKGKYITYRDGKLGNVLFTVLLIHFSHLVFISALLVHFAQTVTQSQNWRTSWDKGQSRPQRE